MLCLQKVVFKHIYGSEGEEYIVPNYLPLVNEADDDFDLHTFDLGKPRFILKFNNFLPFGLINQLIFFFGKLPSKKRFWRDQLLFKFNEHTKVLIQIDFEKLEIRTYCSFTLSNFHEKNDTLKYLFFSLLGLYWDMELLEFKDFQLFLADKIKKDSFSTESETYKKIENCERLFAREQCRPLDLYISNDGENFIWYNDLCSDDCLVNIKSFKKLPDETLQQSPRVLSVYPFQPFTNRQLVKEKTAVISYSKKDLDLVDKFKQYLIPLNDDGLLQHPWYCTDLIAGEEWDDEIQRKFNNADVIFFMVSENLMDTKYVLEHEIKDAIDRWDKNKSVKIVPILLRPYHWKRKHPYDLSRFTALPYMARAVTEFPNQAQAWHYISESIRIMLENDVNPENINSSVQGELARIRREIVHKDLQVG